MRLLFIRHADPDYARDSLTPRGKEEAFALAETLREQWIDAVFCSPLGRAKRTMEVGLSLRAGQLPVEILPCFANSTRSPRIPHSNGLGISCPRISPDTGKTPIPSKIAPRP